MNELTFTQSDIQFIPASLNFRAYEKLKEEATELAEFINSVVVSEDTLQSSKKLLAESRKAIKNLNAERIRIKNELMQPYKSFKDQIKEIETIVNEANETVDRQVKQLEETERLLKKEEIYHLWEKQLQAYKYKDLLTFEHWFEDKFLNKTVSMSKIEEVLNDWLEKRLNDLDFLSSKDNNAYMAEYLNSFDVTIAMKTVEDRERIIESLKPQEEDVIGFVEEEKAIFEITGKANIKLTEMLLKENEITYRKV